MARVKVRTFKPGKYGKGTIPDEAKPEAQIWRVGKWDGTPHHDDVAEALGIDRPMVTFHIDRQSRFFFHHSGDGHLKPKEPAKLAAAVERQHPGLKWGRESVEQHETTAKTLAMNGRPLRDFEKGAHLHVLDWTHDTARHRFQAAGAIQVKAASKAVVNGKVDAPPSLPSLEAALHGELRKLYAVGHATVRSELDHQQSGEALPVGLSKAPSPPNLRTATGKKRCSTCHMFDSGKCWGFGNYPVKPAEVCDNWAAETVKTLDWHFDPDEPRDWHGRWSGGNETEPAWKWSEADVVHRYGFRVSTGGDAVPGGYNGYFAAYDPKTGEKMGWLDYNSAGREAVIADLQVLPAFQRQQVASKLFDYARRYDPEMAWRHGMTTDQGSAWVKSLPPELQRNLIPPLAKALSVHSLQHIYELAIGDPPRDPGTLRFRASLIASDVAHRIFQAVHRARLQGITDKRRLRQLGREAGHTGLRVAASSHAGGAISAGRQAAANGHGKVIGARYTSVLDKSTCGPCAEADTGQLLPLDQVPPAPNPACLGGDRCRCILVYQLSTESTRAPIPPTPRAPEQPFPDERDQPDRASGSAALRVAQVGVGAS